MQETTLSTILVAVYGTLRRHCGNWEWYLNNHETEFLGESLTEPSFTMYNLGSFPAVKREGNNKIKIEVFKITPAIKRTLDRLEGYEENCPNNLYDVTTINTEFGEAIMYVMNRPLDKSKMIESGDWKNVKKKR